MNRIDILLILLNVSINCLGQIKFEKGYFINNENQRTECFIKNNDWHKNPTEFQYKLMEDSETKETDIKEVKEFSILNYSRYRRVDVDIDTSFSTLDKLSTIRNPLWKSKQLFLKVLIEGKASLYYYFNGSYERFFYSCNDTAIKQLVHKEYYYNDNITVSNNSFRQQLINDVSCSKTSINSANNIDYNIKELEKYFHHYNSCVDTSYVKNDNMRTKSEFNLGFSTGLNYSSLSAVNHVYPIQNTYFDHELSLRFGADMEFILPFNKNKWGIEVETFYQSYNSQKITSNVNSTINFSSIDLAIGVRYFFNKNNHRKFFIDFYFNSILSYIPELKIGIQPWYSYSPHYYYTNRTPVNIALGGGFEYKRIYAGLRYYSSQNFFATYPSWYSYFKKTSFIIGYKIIKIRPNI